MVKLISLAVGVSIISLLSSPTATPTPSPSSVSTSTVKATNPPLVAPEVVTKWERVAWCETHSNWKFEGANYDGGLGISRTNWNYYKGTDFAPAPHLATREEQILVAIRINGDYVPDQDGTCSAW